MRGFLMGDLTQHQALKLSQITWLQMRQQQERQRVQQQQQRHQPLGRQERQRVQQQQVRLQEQQLLLFYRKRTKLQRR
jgi:hypothetical protein